MIRFAIISIMLVLLHPTSSMYIPQDIELLDGYDIDEPSEIYPDDSYIEIKSLRSDSGLIKAIRNKRSPLYRVLESPGLHSHFHLDTNNIPIVINDNMENVERVNFGNLKMDNLDREKRSESSFEETPSSLPTPEKQVMPSSDFYRENTNWNLQPFNTEYINSKPVEEEDTLADATNKNEGMVKGRSPRVNFITQHKKNMDEEKERPLIAKLSHPKSRYEKIETPYPSRSYDPYLRRYDRFDDQYNRYDPYYEDYYLYRRRYDPYDSYSPRTPAYPEPYYNYPDRRFDTPEPRDYNPLYSNDIYERPKYHPTFENRNRRIIYYAHLPEIVRAPPTIDLNYRYGRNRYDAGYLGPLSGAYQADGPDYVKRQKKDHRTYMHHSKKVEKSYQD